MGWKRIWGLTDKDGQLKAVSEVEPKADDIDVEAIARAAAGTPKAEVADELKRLREDNERLKAAAQGQPKVEDLARPAAEAWAGQMVADAKLIPAEKDLYVGLYAQAVLDDIASPIAGGRGRVEMLRAPVEARPRLSLTTEQVRVEDLPADAQVLPPHRGGTPGATEPTADGEEPTSARMEHLLSLTDAGNKVLALRAK